MSLPKLITDLNLNLILDNLMEENLKNATYWKTAIMLGAFAGLRIKEVINLKIDDINFEESTITILNSKTHGFEVLPIPNFLLEQLWLHFKTYSKDIVKCKNYLFFSRYKNSKEHYHITWKTLDNMIRGICKSLDMNEIYGYTKNKKEKHRFTFHSFRHYYIQKICDKMGVYYAMICARHKYLNSTMIYLQNSLERKRIAIDNVFNDKIQIYKEELSLIH